MKKLNFIICLILGALTSIAQSLPNTMNIYLSDREISFFLDEIEAISHNASSVCVNAKNSTHEFLPKDIQRITFSYNDRHVYYSITKEELEGWDEGCVDSNGCFVVCRKEADGGYFAFLGELDNAESGITLKFDSDYNIQSIFSKKGIVNVITVNGKDYLIFDLAGNFYIKEFGETANPESYVNSVATQNMSALSALSKICDWTNNAMTAGDFMNLLSNGSDYLPGFLGGMGLTSSIWGLNPFGSLGLGLLLNWAEKAYEDDYYRLLYDYMGAGNVYISDIKEDNAPNYDVETTVSGINTIGMPMTCSARTGVAVRVNDSHVAYDACDMTLGDHSVSKDEIYNANLNAMRGDKYYLRPYLIVVINGLDATPLTRPPYLWGGTPQPLVIYGDVQTVCFNPNISASTGEASDITNSSAIVECTYSGVPSGAVCGVEYSVEDKVYRQTVESGDGTKKITLSNLEPITTYTYTAYVEYAGETYYAPGAKSFTTDIPDITGTWNCVQKNWDRISQTYRDETYTITLKADGSVSSTKGSIDPVSSGWTYSAAGVLKISIMDMATQTYNHGYEWSFKTDTPKKPELFEGSMYGWNYNSVIGYKQGDSSSCTLVR